MDRQSVRRQFHWVTTIDMNIQSQPRRQSHIIGTVSMQILYKKKPLTGPWLGWTLMRSCLLFNIKPPCGIFGTCDSCGSVCLNWRLAIAGPHIHINGQSLWILVPLNTSSVQETRRTEEAVSLVTGMIWWWTTDHVVILQLERHCGWVVERSPQSRWNSRVQSKAWPRDRSITLSVHPAVNGYRLRTG